MHDCHRQCKAVRGTACYVVSDCVCGNKSFIFYTLIRTLLFLSISKNIELEAILLKPCDVYVLWAK